MFRFLCIALLAFGARHASAADFLDEHPGLTTIEFVNAHDRDITIVEVKPGGVMPTPLRIVHKLSVGQCNGVFARPPDTFCAFERHLMPDFEKLPPIELAMECQTLRTLKTRIMIFHSPVDVCGEDLGDAVGVCTVPLRRGEAHFYREAAKNKGSERLRHQMIRNHPRHVPHFTPIGYKKMRLPDDVWQMYKEFWEENRHRGVPELWPTSSSYVNHWDRPVIMVHNTHSVKAALFSTMREILSDWINVTSELEPVSCYGTRHYERGHWLRNHVDITSTHVVSAIIHMAHDPPDVDWPLEVVGHDGVLTRVAMQPQDIVLYESASVIHGRPEVYEGNEFAGTFIHFKPREPEYWSGQLKQMHEAMGEDRAISHKNPTAPVTRSIS